MRNNSPRSPHGRRPADSLNRGSRADWCFFLALNALRSLVWPYAGITHDAKLYSFQVMNRATAGMFERDLFFRYGSQDGYSIFSTLLAPLATTLGLTLSFFLVYVASTALLIFAEMRLVRRLIPDRLAANLALVLLAVTDLAWGGWGVFHVHEPFLTARLPAVAITLLALGELLRKRCTSTFLLMLLALAVHPLMAVGGLLVAVASVCLAKLPLKVVLAMAALAALAAAVVLAYRPLGGLLFGYVDPRWYDIVRRRTPYSFPSAWKLADWWRIAYGLGILGVACKYLDRHGRSVVRLVMLLGLGAVAGSVAAEARPYALLLAGQPYRGLWLLQFLAVPLGVLVGCRLWEKGTLSARLWAIFILCFTGRLFPAKSFDPESVASAVAMFPILLVLFALLFYRRRSQNGATLAPRPGWLCSSLLASLVVTGGFLSLTSLLGLGAYVWGETNPLWMFSLVPWVCSHGIVALGGLLLIVSLWSVTKDIRKMGVAAGIAWGGLSAAAFFFPNDLAFWYPFADDRADVRFVRQCVDEHRREPRRPPVVYWPTDPAHVWYGIPANSFYCWAQSAGVAFSRGTAVESQRRAVLVRRFEIANLRGIYNPEVFRDYYAPFYQADIDEPGPTRQDLIALAHEELDFVVLRRAFRDLVAATNGRVFVYDCRSIRASQGGDGAGAVAGG